MSEREAVIALVLAKLDEVRVSSFLAGAEAGVNALGNALVSAAKLTSGRASVSDIEYAVEHFRKRLPEIIRPEGVARG